MSVVIPAYDAEATLAETLDSVLAQTFEAWEAIVVDDGSADRTGAIADTYADRDSRIRVVRRHQGGASAARNTGIAAARGEWLLFLDSDDWLLPGMLDRLLGIVDSGGATDAAFGLATRVGDTAEPIVSEFGGRDDFFRIAGRACPFAIHGGIVRRSLVERVGGFDEGLRTCEDWDLWQRVIRSGARIEHVDEVVAYYRLRPESLSIDGERLLRDGLEVIRRVHAPDPRVPEPARAYADGLPPGDAPSASLGLVGWAAGLALGAGGDGLGLLERVGPIDAPSADPAAVAAGICLAAPISRARSLTAWLELWPELEARITAFAEALEERVGIPGFARRTLLALEREVLARAEPVEPTVVGRTYVVPLELTDPIERLPALRDAERLHCFVRLEGIAVGPVETPVCEGVVRPEVLADRIAAEHAWSILGVLQARAEPGAPESERWAFFLRELWGLPWAEGRFYDPAARAGERAEVRDAEDAVVEVEVAGELPSLRVGGRTLAVVPTVGGARLGVVHVAARRGIVTPQALRAAITTGARFELCRAAMREAIVGRAPLTSSLRERLRETAAARRERDAGAAVLERRMPTEIGTSVSRRAALPISSLGDVAAAAETAQERVRRYDGATAVVYEPEAFDAAGVSGAATRPPPLPIRALRRAVRRETTTRLPILMYHQVADEGPAATQRYRVPPAAFAEHVDWLRSEGYESVSLREWHRALVARQPLRGRRIAVSFDDGYRDFAATAWPILRQSGFSAAVLVVTDGVGGSNDWDDGQAELLNWDEIESLARDGVEFGGHSATHRPLTTLSPAEVVREAARARAALQERLGRPETLFAYPYGDTDGVVQHLVGAVGFTTGLLSIRPGAATFDDSPLALPRIEVAGGDGADDLAAKLRLS